MAVPQREYDWLIEELRVITNTLVLDRHCVVKLVHAARAIVDVELYWTDSGYKKALEEALQAFEDIPSWKPGNQ